MKKVLIMEDEENIRSFVVINLRRAGYEVLEASTGMQALERLQQHPDVGVAILDIMLQISMDLKYAAEFVPITSRWALLCSQQERKRWIRLPA